MEQGSAEWIAARLGHITASRFGEALMPGRKGEEFGKGAFKYLYELVAEHMVGVPSEAIKTKEMIWGTKWEPAARMAYAMEQDGPAPQLVGFVRHPTLQFVGASTDSLVGDDGINEIKCPFTAKAHFATLKSRSIPDEYVEQVQGNMWVSGRQWCDFVSYHHFFPKQHRLAVVRVQRDDEMIAGLERGIGKFHDMLLDHLATWGVEPRYFTAEDVAARLQEMKDAW